MVSNIAILGVGCIGREHIRNLLLLSSPSRPGGPLARIHSVADPDEGSRTLAAELLPKDCKVFSSHVDLLSDDSATEIDGIIVATPNYNHIDVIRDVFRLSKAHILVEKPLCTTVQDCEEVSRLISESDDDSKRLVWVGMEYRFIPSISQLIEEADRGTAGKPAMLTIREHRFPFLAKVGAWNRFNDTSGGTLVEKCCHFFDLMRRILRSDPVKVIGSGGQNVNHKNEDYSADGRGAPDIIDNAFVIVEFANGARALLDLCMFAENSRNQEELCLIGDLGKVEAFGAAHGQKHEDASHVNFRIGLRPAPSVWSSSSSADPPDPAAYPPAVESHIGVGDDRLMEAGAHEGSTYFEMERFCWAMRGEPRGLDSLVTVEEGTWAVAVGAAAQMSIARGGIPVLMRDVLTAAAGTRGTQ